MFNELLDSIGVFEGSPRLDQVFETSLDVLTRQLAEPYIEPCDFDVTIEGWLDRISIWGKLNITYVDPEHHSKKKVSKDTMRKRLTDLNLNRMMGRWDYKVLDINKLEMSREYSGIDGKTYTEKFIIKIDLRPELKKAKRGR